VPPDQDVRWKQRFSNFDRAFLLLREGLERGPGGLNSLEKEGIIQRFEYTFELAWKTAKDYLEQAGLVITPLTPRQVLKTAFSSKLVADGQVWIDMINHRNLLSHSYDPTVFDAALASIADRYPPAIAALHDFLLAELNS